MLAALPTDLLMRLCQATPEQLAAIHRFLGGGVLQEATEQTESEARRVFALMKQLEGGAKQWKAPLATVFRLVVLEGHSQRKTARLCGCVAPLISRRVKTIESRFGMSIERLRNFASTILEMEASVKGDRTLKRSRGAPKEERAGDDDGHGWPDVVEGETRVPPGEIADGW